MADQKEFLSLKGLSHLWGIIKTKLDVKAAASDLTVHTGNKNNPHGVTAAQVGADPTGTAATAVSTHNTNTAAHNDIRLLISTLTTRLNALANSEDVDLDQMAELVEYIKDNRELIEQVTTNKVSVSDIINNLTTNVSNKPLSAAQGVELKRLIDVLQTAGNNAVPNTRKVNGKALSSDITLSASDVGAVSDSGATMTGNLVISTSASPQIVISNTGTSRYAVLLADSNGSASVGTHVDTENIVQLKIRQETSELSNALDLIRTVSGASKTYHVLHTGNKDLIFTYGTTDLTAGSSSLKTGELYFVYE